MGGTGTFAVGPKARLLAAVVPEPGAWVVLIGGLGMIGAATRRRRAALVPSVSGGGLAD
jgi:hypothetical protein